MGFMWLFDNWARRKTDASLRYRALLGWNLLVIAIGSFLMVAGVRPPSPSLSLSSLPERAPVPDPFPPHLLRN